MLKKKRKNIALRHFGKKGKWERRKLSGKEAGDGGTHGRWAGWSVSQWRLWMPLNTHRHGRCRHPPSSACRFSGSRPWLEIYTLLTLRALGLWWGSAVVALFEFLLIIDSLNAQTTFFASWLARNAKDRVIGFPRIPSTVSPTVFLLEAPEFEVRDKTLQLQLLSCLDPHLSWRGLEPLLLFP